MGAKKTFKNVDNPALRFISAAEETEERDIIPAQQAPATSAASLKGFTPKTEKVETKSRRLQLLIKPSVYDRVKQIAEQSDLSVNDLINQILEEVVKGE